MDYTNGAWVSFSNPSGNCVETWCSAVNCVETVGSSAIRDSKLGDQSPVIEYGQFDGGRAVVFTPVPRSLVPQDVLAARAVHVTGPEPWFLVMNDPQGPSLYFTKAEKDKFESAVADGSVAAALTAAI